MNCPHCGAKNQSSVSNTRHPPRGDHTTRMRTCLQCLKAWKTTEVTNAYLAATAEKLKALHAELRYAKNPKSNLLKPKGTR